MLKRRGKLLRLIHEDPALADWWIAQERSVANRTGPDGRACESVKRFRLDETYAELKAAALSQNDLFVETHGRIGRWHRVRISRLRLHGLTFQPSARPAAPGVGGPARRV